MKKKLTTLIKFLFFSGLGVLLVWLALREKSEQELHEIVVSIKQANYFWIFLSVVISGLSHYFRAVRWKILLEPLGHHPKTSNAFFSIMVGYLVNLALPRVGEVTRCGVLARYEKVPFVEGFGTLLAERALDVVCVIILFFMTLAIEFEKISGIANDLIFNSVALKFHALMQKRVFLMVALAGLIIIVALFMYFRKKIAALMSGKVKGFAVGLWNGLLSVKKVNKPFLFILHTILIWLMYVLQVYVVFFAFNGMEHLPFVAAMVITVFGSLAVAVVPGGTGVYQIIVVQILTSVYLISASTSNAFAWSVWASQFILILALGLASLSMLALLNKNNEAKAEL